MRVPTLQVLDFALAPPQPAVPGRAVPLASFRAQVGAVRVSGCELVRVIRSNGESKGIHLMLPQGVEIASRTRAELRRLARAEFFTAKDRREG